MATIGKISAKITLNSSDFEKDLTSLRRGIKAFGDEAKIIGQGFNIYRDGQKTLQGQIKATSEQMEMQKKVLAELSKQYEANVNSTGTDGAGAQRKMVDIQKLRLDMAQTAKEFEDLNLKLQNLQHDMNIETGERMIEKGQSIMQFGYGLREGGTQVYEGAKFVANGLKSVIDEAVRFEDNFANVRKTVDASPAEFEALSRSIRDLSTEIPVGTEELTNLATVAGQLGIETPNILSFTEVIAKMGVSTNLAGEEGATSMAKFANITRMNQEEFENLGSTLVYLGNNYATTERDVLNLAERMAAAGTQAGMTEAEILGIAAGMSSVGIEAESGGTAMSKMFTNLQLAASNGVTRMKELHEKTGLSARELELMASNTPKEFKDLADSIGMTTKEINNITKSARDMEKFSETVGMTTDEFAKLIQTDPAQAFVTFSEALGKMDADEAVTELQKLEITEVRLRDAVLRSASAHEDMQSALDGAKQAWGDNNSLQTEAERKFDTTASKMTMAKNKLTDLKVEMGNAFLPAVADLLENMQPLVGTLENFANWLNKMPKGFTSSIIGITGITMGLGKLGQIAGNISLLYGGTLVKVGSKIKDVAAASKAMNAGAEAFQATTPGLIGGLKKLISAKSGLATQAGNVSKDLYGLKNVATQNADELMSMAGAASKAGGAIGLKAGLGAKVVALGTTTGGALAIGALAIGAVATAIWGIKEASDHINLEGGRKWGVPVTDEQDRIITNTEKMQTETSVSLGQVRDGFEDTAEVARANMETLATKVEDDSKRINTALSKAFNELPEWMQTQLQSMVKSQQSLNEILAEQTKAGAEEVNTIVSNAKKENRNLTIAEEAKILEIQTRGVEAQLRLAGFSAAEAKKIAEAATVDIRNMNQRQLNETANYLENSLSKSNEAYKKQADKVKEISKTLNLTKEQEAELIGQLKKQYDDHSINTVRKLKEVGEALGITSDQMRTYLHANGATSEQIEQVMKETTITTINEAEKLREAINRIGGNWNELKFDPKTGEITIDNETFTIKAWMATDMWKNLTFDEKVLLMNNDPVQVALLESVHASGQWEDYEIVAKEIDGDNAELIMSILSSKESLENWKKIPDPIKKVLAENVDLLKKVNDGTATIREFNLYEVLKKEVGATDETWNAVKSAIDNISKVRDKTVYIDSIYRSYQQYSGVDSRAYADRYEKGTNYFQGGLAMVNDQTLGSLYREAIQLPTGETFIPQGRNVLLDLPRGSRVIPAGLTKAMFPHFEKGLNINMPRFKNDFKNAQPNISGSSDGKMTELINMFKQFMSQPAVNNSPTIVLENVTWQNEKDIRQTLQDILWQTQINERGALT
ncbi:MAG: phage tail tape measure protein [Streptococcaceae bacterium]|jgi:TP901 family phage tail tape measure protein|nr:phage tail tape measure protein [Streptococcaceae bacterium]